MIGKRILPWKNPIEYPSRGLRGGNIALAASSSVAVTAGSTTNTSDYQTVMNATFEVSTPRSVVYVFANFRVSHSVSGANYSIAYYFYQNYDGTGFLAAPAIETIDLVTADQNYVVPSPMVVAADASNIGLRPGTKSVYVAVKNLTAGTLSWGRSGDSGDFINVLVVPYA